MSGAVGCTIAKDREDSVEKGTLSAAATLFSTNDNAPPGEIELATSVNDAGVAPALPKSSKEQEREGRKRSRVEGRGDRRKQRKRMEPCFTPREFQTV